MTTDPIPSPKDPGDEFDRHDDAIIGRAFAWSMVVFLAIALIGGVIWAVVALQEPPEEEVIEKQIAAPEALVADLAVLPKVHFASVAEQAGLDVTHVSGARGEKLLPETMGGGVAFVDLDDDGDQDLMEGGYEDDGED